MDLLLGVPPFLVSDDQRRSVAEPPEAADDRGIVRVAPVTVDLVEILDQMGHVIQGVGTFGMARHERFLPRAEGGEYAGAHRLELLPQLLALALRARVVADPG